MKSALDGSMAMWRRLRLPCCLVVVFLAVLCWHGKVGAQFTIGVWQPGGHTAAEASFTQADSLDLVALGIDLLVDSTPRVDDSYFADHTQDFEEVIMPRWNRSGGVVAFFEPEDNDPNYGNNLERYAGTTGTHDQTTLNDKVDALIAKWNPFTGFYGYRIGHEADPTDSDGIYNSATYGNLAQVIHTVRNRGDITRRLIALGNVTSTGTWTLQEQADFRDAFFRPEGEAGPANVFMHEQYRLWSSTVSETDVQTAFDDLMEGWNRVGAMVRTARSSGRKAEWHFVANVGNQYTTSGPQPHYRAPTIEELRAQVNLALSRGAKGITYFLYTSSTDYIDGYQYEALVNTSSPRGRIQPHWNTVRAVNDSLRPLGDACYPLVWVDGFPQTSIPANNLVVCSTGSRAEFGTFYHPGESDRDYLLVVNRDNLTSPAAPQTMAVVLQANNLRHAFRGQGVYYLTNMVSGERQVRGTDANGYLLLYCPMMAPGSARLFRIERVQTWSGTVTLTGDVTVPAGTSLTVNPAAQVVAVGGADVLGTGTWPDRVELIVQGTLELPQAALPGAIFRSSYPTAGSWGGIRIDPGGSAILNGADIRDAKDAIRLNGAVGTLTWGTSLSSHTQISNCQQGIFANGVVSRTIDNVDLSLGEGAGGVTLQNCSQTTLSHVSVVGASGTLVNVSGGSGNVVDHCTLQGVSGANQSGVYLSGPANPTVTNCAISAVGYGMEISSSTGVTATHNNLENVTCRFPGLVPAGQTNYGVPARQADATGHLLAASPLINAGASGSTDIGRYGGTDDDAPTATASIYYGNAFDTSEDFSEGTGTWSRANRYGDWRYAQDNPYGITRSTRPGPVGNCYTLGARIRFDGGYQCEGKLIFAQADQNELYRIDLMNNGQKVRVTANGVIYNSPSGWVQAGQWYDLEAHIANNTISVFCNGQAVPGLQGIAYPAPATRVFGMGTYEGTAVFDNVYVLNENEGGGGGEILVNDQFNNGDPSGWGVHSGSWSEWGEFREVSNLNGEGICYCLTHLTSTDYTIRTRMNFGSWAGKVVYDRGNIDGGRRVDLLAQDDMVRVCSPTGDNYFPFALSSNTWYEVEVRVQNNAVSVWVNGQPCNQNVSIGEAPNGYVGLGSYGPTHSSLFDYFTVTSGAGGGGGGGGGGALVEDEFNDGQIGNWGFHGEGTWDEPGGNLRVANLDGEGIAYYTSGLGTISYTIKTRLNFGSWAGKVVYDRGNIDGGRRVDLLAQDDVVRICTPAGNNLFQYVLESNTWYNVDVEVYNNAVSVWINGQPCNQNVPIGATPNGYVGLGAYGPTHTTLFDYFRVYEGQRAAKKPAPSALLPCTRIAANYPNPFNPQTLIPYELAAAGPVQLKIYSVLGQEVRRLVSDVQEAGYHQVTWDGRDSQGHEMASGVFLCRLVTPDHSETRKVLLVR